MTPPPGGIRQRESRHRVGRSAFESGGVAAVAGGASRLLDQLDTRGAALLLTLPLFWVSYPGLLFDLFGFDPAAAAALDSAQSWSLLGVLGLHLLLCHWLSMRIGRLCTQLRRRR